MAVGLAPGRKQSGKDGIILESGVVFMNWYECMLLTQGFSRRKAGHKRHPYEAVTKMYCYKTNLS